MLAPSHPPIDQMNTLEWLASILILVNYYSCVSFCFRLYLPRNIKSRHRLLSYAVDHISSSNRSLSGHRVGLGYDIHRLVSSGIEGKPLTLGGIRLDDSGVYVLGHSDGDAVLHAISDAVLGAVGLGDIGEHFPDSDPAIRDIDSSHILQFALEEACKLGYSPCNVDINIILQRPKLGAEWKRRIRSSVCEMLGGDVCVNVKAKTNEGLDSIGAGNAIACQSVVLLERID